MGGVIRFFLVLLAVLVCSAPLLAQDTPKPTDEDLLARIERDPAHALDASERQSLDREIAVIEAKYFAPDGDVPAGNGQSGAELRTVLERWMRGAGAAGSR